MSDVIRKHHKVCELCRTHPFNLCTQGALLLGDVAAEAGAESIKNMADGELLGWMSATDDDEVSQ